MGGDLAYHSSLGVATLLGAPMPPGTPADQLTTVLARKTRSELYEYLNQMKGLMQANPTQARQLLADNPSLTKALFQAQVILGMVGNPLGDVAPKGARNLRVCSQFACVRRASRWSSRGGGGGAAWMRATSPPHATSFPLKALLCLLARRHRAAWHHARAQL